MAIRGPVFRTVPATLHVINMFKGERIMPEILQCLQGWGITKYYSITCFMGWLVFGGMGDKVW